MQAGSASLIAIPTGFDSQQNASTAGVASGIALVCDAAQAPAGLLSQDEVLRIDGSRAVRSVNGRVRAQYTTAEPLLDAAWCRFSGSQRRVLCLLQADLLTVVTAAGDVREVPLPTPFQRLHPLMSGVLLTGKGADPRALQHPLEQLLPVVAQPGGGVFAAGSWSLETLVWTSCEVPLALTVNQAANTCTVWRVGGRRGTAGMDTATTPAPPCTPATPSLPPGSVPGSAASIRLPNGGISPMAFSPLAFGAAAATPGAPATPSAIPGQQPAEGLPVWPLWHQQFAKGCAPTSACLAENADNCTLLCIVSAGAASLTALRISSTYEQVHVAFQLASVAAAAAVSATRPPRSAHGSQRTSAVPRDLLVLHQGGQLALYVGKQRVFGMHVQPPPEGFPSPLGSEHAGEVSHMTIDEDLMSVDTPAASARQPAQAGSPGRSGGQPIVTGLRHAAGDRVTLELEGGATLRVRLAQAPPGSAAALVMAALRDALSTSAFIAVASLVAKAAEPHTASAQDLQHVARGLLRWLGAPAAAPPGQGFSGGSGGGSGSDEFQTPPRASAPGRRDRRSAGSPTASTAASSTAVAATPSPGVTTRSARRRSAEAAAKAAALAAASAGAAGAAPSGSCAAAATPAKQAGRSTIDGKAAWQELLQSRQHGALLETHCFPWLQLAQQRASPPAAQAAMPALPAEAWQALEGLHALYEDCKLDMLRWHLLPPLGRLLADVARVMGARQYTERYQRDLALAPAAMATAGVPAKTAALAPASMHAALRALLQGEPHQHWVPALAQAGAPSVQRPSDLLHFYSLLAAGLSSSGGDGGSADMQAEVLEDGEPHTPAPGAAAAAAATQLVTQVGDDAQHQITHAHHGEEHGQQPSRAAAEAAVIAMVQRGWTLAEVDSLSIGAALPLRAALLACRAQPPQGWPAEAYILVGRADLAALVAVPRPAQQRASDAAPPAATLLEGFSAAADTPAGHRVHRRRSSKGGRRPAEAAPPMQRGPAALPPYQQRLFEPSGEADGPEAAQASSERRPPGVGHGPAAQRFAKDLRLMEVERLLASDVPVPIALGADQEPGDPELVTAQQSRLLALACRTMARPLGRGALTLGTVQPLPTQGLGVPPLALGGRLTQHNDAVTALATSALPEASGGGAMCDLSAWPEFHNGVAAGLRLAAGGTQLSRTWIVYNKPEDPTYAHAGVLFGLGLTGHLKGLSDTDVYRYLRQEHDATTVGLLLGLGAAYAGTGHASTSTMMFLHVPSRHPQTYPELEVSPPVQAAALVSAGLLYRGTCHRRMAEIMLEEIGHRASDDAGANANSGVTGSIPISSHREGYALAAGAALGLIMLGAGHSAPGVADLRFVDRLRHHMLGGLRSQGRQAVDGPAASTAPNTLFGPDAIIGFDPTQASDMLAALRMGGSGVRAAADAFAEDGGTGDSGSGASQVVLEGERVDVAVSGPGATIALALQFIRTNDAAVAAAFKLPHNAHTLDLNRPDHVLLRVVARALVMWDSVQPTLEWLHAQLPPLVQVPLEDLLKGRAPKRVDAESAAQAHIAILAGGCLVLGLRFAGSQDAGAAAVIQQQLRHFLRCKALVPDAAAGVAGQVDKQALEGCACTAALALSCVLAGSGDLATLKLLRGLARRLQPTARASVEELDSPGGLNYGHHAAVSMALGLLFLGAGSSSFGNSNEAVAALLLALYPRLPSTPQDNRCHLQALRHLYVLAAKPRCLTAVDIETRQPVPAPLRLHLASRPDAQAMMAAGGDSTVDVEAPSLVPGSSQVLGVEVCGPQYWPLRRATPAAADGGRRTPGISSAAAGATLHVQRRLGAQAPGDEPGGLGFAASPAAALLGGVSGVPGDAPAALAKLGATVAAQQPFLSAFAEYFAKELPALAAAGGSAAAERPAGGQSPASEDTAQPEGGAPMPHAAADMLLQCVAAEAPALLPSLLFLHCLTQALVASDSGGGQAASRALCGGLPPAIAMAELRLAAAFCEAAQQQQLHQWQAADMLQGGVMNSNGMGDSQGGPLPPLLANAVSATQLQLQRLWERLGFLPACAAEEGGAVDSMVDTGSGGTNAAAAAQRLRSYLQAGASAASAQHTDTGALPGLYAAFLEAKGVPEAGQLAQLASGLHQQMLAGDGSAAGPLGSTALTSLLPGADADLLPLVAAVCQ